MLVASATAPCPVNMRMTPRRRRMGRGRSQRPARRWGVAEEQAHACHSLWLLLCLVDPVYVRWSPCHLVRHCPRVAASTNGGCACRRTLDPREHQCCVPSRMGDDTACALDRGRRLKEAPAVSAASAGCCPRSTRQPSRISATRHLARSPHSGVTSWSSSVEGIQKPFM